MTFQLAFCFKIRREFGPLRRVFKLSRAFRRMGDHFWREIAAILGGGGGGGGVFLLEMGASLF